MYQNNPTKCLTGEVRLSFVHLDQPYSNNGGEPKYSATLLVPKNDVATAEDLKNALNTAYENGVKNLWKGSRPQMRYPVIYDGDGTRPSGEPFGPECKGHWVITASSKQKPQCVHISNVHADLLPTDVYSGMYGEPLGGRANAESDFAGLEQAAPQQPQNYAAPQQGVNPLTGQPW